MNTMIDISGRADGEFARFRAQIAAEHDACARQESRASLMRLVAFVAVIVVCTLLYSYPAAGIAAALLGTGVFVASIRAHMKIKARCDSLTRVLTVCDEAAQRNGGAVVRVRGGAGPSQAGFDAQSDESLAGATGVPAQWRLTQQELDDLDVFAEPVGLFGILNRCSTAAGERALASILGNPLLDGADILLRQEAVRRLSEYTPARLSLLGACAELRREDQRFAKLIAAIGAFEAMPHPPPRALLMFGSIVSTLAIVFAIVQSMTFSASWFSIAVVVWLVNGAITGRATAHARRQIALFSETAWPARGFACVARCAAEQIPASPLLDALRGRFADVTIPGGVDRLRQLVGWAESGGLFVKLMSLTFYYELHYARNLEACIVQRRDALLSAAAAIAELEALLSLASFAAEQPQTSWPTVAPELRLQILRGRHPLIAGPRVVANDVGLDAAARVWIITGSNMAGKSTFLRMIGVNVLLAQCGSAVCAENMAWRPVRLLTDLRASDSLADGESYFLAEVRHVRRMICAERSAHPLLGLIDEPFRGTNSQEQTAAGVAITKRLIASEQLFLVATHDRALTLLADGQTAHNFHFREEIGPEGMTFDYQLRSGPATTRNALRVLARERYPESVLADAHTWLEHTTTGAASASAE
ncbi:MAG: hypothetical protein JNG88_13265 [Phycisphaerales bacterium]|nr:hypothetical protein [Phycisphaerales bacterium]